MHKLTDCAKMDRQILYTAQGQIHIIHSTTHTNTDCIQTDRHTPQAVCKFYTHHTDCIQTDRHTAQAGTDICKFYTHQHRLHTDRQTHSTGRM